jgi:hypothetical protein
MKLTQLLSTRERLLREANLANMAFAYVTLCNLARRVAQARLGGLVALRQADEAEDNYWASLTAVERSQAVLDEHFGDDDVTDMADAISFSTGSEFSELQFRLEDIVDLFVAPLRASLEREGVAIDVSRDYAGRGPSRRV